MSNLDSQHQDRLIEWLSSHTPTLQHGADAYYAAMCDLTLPHVQMRPNVYLDGDKWCALYGEDIMKGVVGFGKTPAKACEAFDIVWDKGD